MSLSPNVLCVNLSFLQIFGTPICHFLPFFWYPKISLSFYALCVSICPFLLYFCISICPFLLMFLSPICHFLQMFCMSICNFLSSQMFRQSICHFLLCSVRQYVHFFRCSVCQYVFSSYVLFANISLSPNFPCVKLSFLQILWFQRFYFLQMFCNSVCPCPVNTSLSHDFLYFNMSLSQNVL